MWTLRLLGRASIEGPEGPLTGRAAQRRVLALLAVLAVDRAGAVRRDRLTLLLSPEADSDRARHLLRDSVYAARSALGEDAILSNGDELQLSRELLSCDVWEFERALDGDDLPAAAQQYAGNFLDGFHLQDSPEFDRWAALERTRLESRYAEALEALAEAASTRGAPSEAATWWGRRLAMDPLNARVTRSAMVALEAAGDAAGALRRASMHAALMDSELGATPDASVSALAERIRRNPQEVAAPPIASPLHPMPDERAPLAPTTSERVVDEATVSPFWTRRSAASATVMASVAALVAIGLWSRQPSAPPPSHPATVPRRVAVAPLRNATGDSALAAIGWMAADWTIQGIVATGLAEVVPLQASASARTSGESPGVPDSTFAGVPSRMVEDSAGDADLARNTGAGLVVRGAFYREGDSLLLNGWVTDARSGVVRHAVETVRGSVSLPLASIEQFRARILAALAPFIDERMAATAGASAPPPSFDAYREHAEGLERFMASDLVAARDHFAAAARSEPGWATPRVWAALARWNLGDHAGADSVARSVQQWMSTSGTRLLPIEQSILQNVLAWVRGDRVAAYEAARRGRDAAPGSQMAAAQVAVEALRLNRAPEAVSVLRALDPDRGELRGWVYYWVDLAESLHLTGAREAEWAAVGGARTRHPESAEGRLIEVRALAAEGRAAELQRALDDVMSTPAARFARRLGREAVNELRAHGHAAAAESLMQRTRGDASPPAASSGTLGQLDAMGRRALRALQQGDTSTAQQMATELSLWRQPYSFGREHWWRSAVLAARGDCVAGVAAMREAMRGGQEFGMELHNAAELETLRRCPQWGDFTRPRDR